MKTIDTGDDQKHYDIIKIWGKFSNKSGLDNLGK